jgi:hypothetical protein
MVMWIIVRVKDDNFMLRAFNAPEMNQNRTPIGHP